MKKKLINIGIFRKPKKTISKILYKTASNMVAEPMIELLKSTTYKPAVIEEPPEL